ncbi:MAG: hypothetical protein FWG65_00600 [Turicibacter sp.]|nr:hypothetical protein [Turicibacter sp.]
MLTNVYYYKFYKPYIIGRRGENGETSKQSRIAEMTPHDKLQNGMIIVFNKSLKKEIVEYVKNVAHSVTGLKSAVHAALTDMGSFGLNAMYDGYDSALDLIEDDMLDLVDIYNESSVFLREQDQSEDLRQFSLILKEGLQQGSDRLKSLGLTLDSDLNTLHYDKSKLRNMTTIEMHATIGANIQLFHSLHQNATEILSEPLSAHMRFDGLSYSFSYRIANLPLDGYDVIHAGMVVDRVL